MEETHQICRRKNGKWRCKNVSGDNKLQYYDKHYKNKKEIEENNNLPPDEVRCCLTDRGGWRCKNLRMSHGAAAADGTVPKTNRCEKHYYYYVNYHKNLKEKKRTGNGEETRGSKRRKNKVTAEGDETEIQKLMATNFNDTSDTQIGSTNIGTKRKNVERTEESGELDFTDFLTENPPLITTNKMLKKMKEKKKLPPDEQRCCVKGGGLAGGGRWRCKNFRMGYGSATDDGAVYKTRYCEKHYILRENIKRRLRDGADGTGNKNVGATSIDTTVTIVEGGTGSIRRKRKIVERTEGSGEPESSTKTREPLVEFESVETCNSKCLELSVDLDKKKVECTKLQGELGEVIETIKTNAMDEAEQTPADAAERWRKMLSEIESQVWGMENSYQAMGECVEASISIFESLVLSSRKESLILEKSNKPFVNLVSDDDSE